MTGEGFSDNLQRQNNLFRMRAGFRATLLYLIFFFSGAVALGYQIAWVRLFANGLGHEMPATLAVIAAFMGGMGLGAWRLDKSINRSAQPGYWYATLELVIGLWAFVSVALIPLANRFSGPLIGLAPSGVRHWAVAFGLPFALILPATVAMGATFPAMERFVAPLAADGRCVGAVYAANTIGAVAGTLLSAFLVVPALGLRASVCSFALINLACAATAYALQRRSNYASSRVKLEPTEASVPPVGIATRNSQLATLFRLCCTGLLGIGYETVGIRVLSQVLENTVYTFAAVLSVFLLGTAIGAAAYHRWLRRRAVHLLATDLLCGLSLACMLGVLALSRAQLFYELCRNAMGDSQSAVLGAEMAVAAAVFGVPTLFMGALFSHLVQASRRNDGGVGSAAAVNTFGGAVAPALFGVLLLPAVGSKWTLVLISLGYLGLVSKMRPWRWLFPLLPLSLLLILPGNLQIVQKPPGGKLADYREGAMASVAVLEDAAGHKTLRVNNRFQMGGTAAAEAEYRHAHIPLLLHPAPKRALFLGLGTGITFGAASLHPGLASDGVELVPEVVAVMPEFEPYNFAPERQPQLTLHVADARRFIRTASGHYDVIVADLFHPARDGAGSLYTVEHFRAVRERLSPGGLFCQWLPLHQLDEQMLRIIVHSFLEVFPTAQAYLLRLNVDAPVVGLMGSSAWPHYSGEWVEKRLVDPAMEKQLKQLALADSLRLFGGLVAGPQELRQFAGNAPLNKDDRPRVTFQAPQFTYQKQANPYGRLTALLEHRVSSPAELLQLGPDPAAQEFARRLSRYTQARDVYIHGLVAQSEGRSPEALEAFVESARLSEDFTSGYAQCLTIASLEAKTNPQKARALLQRLVEAQPSRAVAAEMMKRLPTR